MSAHSENFRPPTFAERLATLEADSLRCAEDRRDIELRLRSVERALWIGFGALGGLQLLLKFI